MTRPKKRAKRLSELSESEPSSPNSEQQQHEEEEYVEQQAEEHERQKSDEIEGETMTKKPGRRGRPRIRNDSDLGNSIELFEQFESFEELERKAVSGKEEEKVKQITNLL